MNTVSLHTFRIELKSDLRHAFVSVRMFLAEYADCGRRWAMTW